MTTREDVYEFNLPAVWALALVNGDRSLMSKEQEQVLDAFLDHHGDLRFKAMDASGNTIFTSEHDAAHFGAPACYIEKFVFVRG